MVYIHYQVVLETPSGLFVCLFIAVVCLLHEFPRVALMLLKCQTELEIKVLKGECNTCQLSWALVSTALKSHCWELFGHFHIHQLSKVGIIVLQSPTTHINCVGLGGFTFTFVVVKFSAENQKIQLLVRKKRWETLAAPSVWVVWVQLRCGGDPVASSNHSPLLRQHAHISPRFHRGKGSMLILGGYSHLMTMMRPVCGGMRI